MLKSAWTIWCVLTAAGAAWLIYALPGERSVSASAVFVPGETTHGHYQIEMKCATCHQPDMSVTDASCIDCHQAELKASRDTHPKSKFNDPTKAVLLAKIDATNCLTCHVEHCEEKTHEMGVTVPRDYCIHCHEDVANDRPSHEDLAFNSCATAGCHNYHDNTALYENFLKKHLGDTATRPRDEALRDVIVEWVRSAQATSETLTAKQADGPGEWDGDASRSATDEWARSIHAAKGVNCSGCHQMKVEGDEDNQAVWQLKPDHESCRRCHDGEVSGFLAGHHGMRLAAGLSPMTPDQARLPMHASAGHKTLDCAACHSAHEPDLKFAAYEACSKCHDDEHTRNYEGSAHHELWLAELGGTSPRGSGVSCASCHMPRNDDGVQHNQNDNLRPNEKMVRSVCLDCHGLQFSLDALADKKLKDNCYSTKPTTSVKSLEMVREWFESRRKKK